jgi:hypothetical protein
LTLFPPPPAPSPAAETEDSNDKGKEREGLKRKRQPTGVSELTPFSFYCSIMRDDLAVEHPNAMEAALDKILAKKWQRLSKSVKRCYEGIVTEKKKELVK